MFQSESNPDPQNFENHQSDPVLIRQYKTMCFILPHEAKQPREAK